MHLLWLRVAAVLYAAASVAVFPAVLYGIDRWRSWCVHLGGMAFFFHFVSAVEMLASAHRWMPVGVREAESLLGLVVVGLFFLAWWLYEAISLGIFALPVTFFLVFVPSLGLAHYVFPSEGVRTSWLDRAHRGALGGLRGAGIQPAGLGALPGAGTAAQGQNQNQWRFPVGSAGLAAAAGHAGADRPCHAAVRLSLHDRGPGYRGGAGAGDAPWALPIFSIRR